MKRHLDANTGYRISCRKFLEELVTRRDFPAACRYFDSLAESLRGNCDLDSGILMRLGAIAFGFNGNLSRALTLIRKAIDILSKIAGETKERAEGYIVLGNILREIGKFQEAEKAYRDAESISRRNDDFPTAGVALNRLAAIHFRRGELDSALKYLLEAVDYAKLENDKKKIAYLFGNIGRVYTSLGKLNDAEQNIRLNIELSSNLNDEIETARAWLSLGYVNIQQAKYENATEALENAKEYISRNKMDKEKIIHMTYCGELMYKTGRFAEADLILNEAFAEAYRIAPESLLAARPLRHLAESAKYHKNYRRSLQLANKAMILMKKLDNRPEIGALLRIQADCFENLNQEKKVQQTFYNAIRVLEECKAKLELADVLTEAGQSNAFDVSRQTMYLCRAEDMYNYCGVESKVTEIQKLIGRLQPDTAGKKANADLSGETNIKIGSRNKKMKKVIAELEMMKDSDLPILLTGETGTGKDFLAKHFHSISRPNGPYVAINLAAVPETLMESELFGYHKGAFTGADANRTGLFMAANKGVLLLDEIGELPSMLQAKLLSVLETRKLRPLGSSVEIDLDIKVISATNRNLYQMVEEGTFRRDLYYRLACFTLELPPLRARKEDIPDLLDFFMRKRELLKKGQQPDPELVRMFVSYDWPGNIRQMENKVKQLSVMASLAKDGSITELSQTFFDDQRDQQSNSLAEQVESFEKRLLLEAYISSGGNKSKAARLLSIHEATFRAKMKRYGLEVEVN